MNDLYKENYKLLKKEIKKEIRKISCAHGLVELT
jgi:hypothetical protein